MSGFSPEWLALREPVDHRSRDAALAAKVAARFADNPSVTVVDLGCGSGSNIRATWALLPADQTWTLVDYDARLLAVARERLATWADQVISDGAGLTLRKADKRLRVDFRQADLTKDLDAALDGDPGRPPDLVTAAALFDLCSEPFIERFAKAVAARRAAFYTVLTYNGVQTWSPAQAVDGLMSDAFHSHQRTDKGFGASSGPAAPGALAKAFRAAGYHVEDGDSPWLLKKSDSRLVNELAIGFAGAVGETGLVDASAVTVWRRIERTGAIVGHTDTWAVPAT